MDLSSCLELFQSGLIAIYNSFRYIKLILAKETTCIILELKKRLWNRQSINWWKTLISMQKDFRGRSHPSYFIMFCILLALCCDLAGKSLEIYQLPMSLMLAFKTEFIIWRSIEWDFGHGEFDQNLIRFF